MSLRSSNHANSVRAWAVSHALTRLVAVYLGETDDSQRRDEPGTLDFTFGDPREMPPGAFVSALQTAAVPQNAAWFAYKMYEPEAQEAAAASLAQWTGLAFDPPISCLPPTASRRWLSG